MTSAGIELSTDKAIAWHAAHIQNGFVVRVPAGRSGGEIILRTRAAGASALHHVIVLEKGASADILIESKGETGAPAAVHTDLCEVFLGEDAKLNLATMQDYPDNSTAFSHTYQTLGKFATAVHLACALGAQNSRTRALNHLNGGRSRAESYQIFAASAKQRMDLRSHSHHAVPDTTGLMTCRGALTDFSFGTYTGKIQIDRAAVNTVSHQAGSALLLSPNARADIIPALEVQNDQVEAGHGASIGGLDEKEIFYLRSRGLDEAGAKRLMLGGYFEQLVSKMRGEKCRSMLRERVEEFLRKRG